MRRTRNVHRGLSYALAGSRFLARRGTLSIKGEKALYEAIWTGGFPGLVTGEAAELRRDIFVGIQQGSIS